VVEVRSDLLMAQGDTVGEPSVRGGGWRSEAAAPRQMATSLYEAVACAWGWKRVLNPMEEDDVVFVD
jgi:hypothetical protein